MNPVTGEYKTVRELHEEQKEGIKPALMTLNEEYKLEKSEAFFVEDNGRKPVFGVMTKHGAEVVLTGNHPVLTVDGWVEVDALKVGQFIATPKSLNYFGTKSIDEEILKFVAMLLGAGQFNKRTVTFQLRYPELKSTFMEIARSAGIEVKEITERTLRLVNFMESDFPYIEDIKNRRIPSIIYSLQKDQVALFLSYLYAAGGWFFAKRIGEIGFATKNKTFALDIKHLLLRFGIQVLSLNDVSSY
jgi:intein/homing endonuclease